MKRIVSGAAIALFSSTLLGAQQPAPQKADSAPSIVGTWTLTSDAQPGVPNTAEFKLDGKKVTGTISGARGATPITGEFADQKLTFSLSYQGTSGSLTLAFTGGFKPDGTLAGTMDYGQGLVNWRAERVKEAVAAVTGKWAMTLNMEQGTATPSIELKQDGEKITGTYTGRYGAFPLTGKIANGELSFTFTMGADGANIQMTFTAAVAADAQSMKGTAKMAELGDVPFTAKRLPEK